MYRVTIYTRKWHFLSCNTVNFWFLSKYKHYKTAKLTNMTKNIFLQRNHIFRFFIKIMSIFYQCCENLSYVPVTQIELMFVTEVYLTYATFNFYFPKMSLLLYCLIICLKLVTCLKCIEKCIVLCFFIHLNL